ncbi:acetylxylan esterase [Salinispira pacifica]|uniref:Acetyl xylan esterase 1, Cephalosporin-C deacetylase n=1 Tax=Salinispira pacifica TaxID=1307761 RepID=V5WE89_9SPIO|nr:alpha/beta fold hydrolase [Salinispira pacifica]AHC13955.1 Acetyl xylan esterase 1, Cephalosporin-C deacetylase [Salinispira pacifica]
MPLTFDMPLEELQSYRGSGPVPADFHKFWDASIKESRNHDARAEIASAGFSSSAADCFHLYLRGVSGGRHHAKLLRPKNGGDGSALLFFHGYSMESSDWVDYLPFVMEGKTVAALDCPGQGGESEDVLRGKGSTLQGHIVRGVEDAMAGDPRALYYVNLFLNSGVFADAVGALEGVDQGRISASGWSQGGALTLAAAAVRPEIQRAAAVYPFLCDYRRVWEIDLARDAYEGIHDYFRHRDPLHSREEEFFTALGYIDLQNFASRIKADTLMFTGLTDTICPPSGQFAVFNRIESPKEHCIYPDFAHENLPGARDRIFSFLCGYES